MEEQNQRNFAMKWNVFKDFCKKVYVYDYIYSMRFEPLLIPLKINSPNLRWNSFSVDRAVNLRDPVNLQESFADKSRWTVRDLSEDLSVEDPVPLFMLQFVDDQIRFEWQTLFAPIFDKPIRFVSRLFSIFDHALQTLNDQKTCLINLNFQDPDFPLISFIISPFKVNFGPIFLQ